MLDIKQIIENPKDIEAKLAKKGCVVDFAPLLKLYDRRKQLLISVENAKMERNNLSASVPQVKKAGGDVNAIFAKVKEIAAKYGIECYYGGSSSWYYMVPNSNWYMVNYYLNEHIIIRKYFKYDVRIKRIIPR